MGFFDQYKSINRSTIAKSDKIGTREMLDESFTNPQWKGDAIQVVKKLLEFKVEQSRSDTAERLLGALTTPLESLNAKRRQAGFNEIAERDLHELVRNRSAIFKRQLPDTFKGLLRLWLRDGEARAILVNTNTAAFLKSNDLITAAEVRTATPEAGIGRQLFANEVAAMMNSLENAYAHVAGPGVFKTAVSGFTIEIAQCLRDYRRVVPQLRAFAEPSFRHMIRTLARASATGGLNRERLLQPQTTIGGVNSLANLRSRIQQKGPGHAWMAKTSRQPLQTTTNWVDSGMLDQSGNIRASAADGTSHQVGVSTGFGGGGGEWIREAQNTFGPEVFSFGEHVSLADGLAAGGARRSQRLSPDVEYISRERFGSYASGFAELRGARAMQFEAGPRDDRAVDAFDMLVMLSFNQGLCSWPNRFRIASGEQRAEIPAVQIVNATYPDGVGGQDVATVFSQFQNWHYPIRISRQSREVEYVMITHADNKWCPVVVPGIAGASQQFWPYKYFTVRFSWCQGTNFVSKTIVDETPWKCSYHRPEWVPPSRGY